MNLDILFIYKGYTISLIESVEDIPFLVKCVSSDKNTLFMRDCITRPEAFRFLYKLLSFIDDVC